MDQKHTPSHYDALELPPHASADEVRQAFRRLAAQHHPDRQDAPDDGAAMARINQAYQVLSDPHQRAEYDFRLRVAASRQARGRLHRASRFGSLPWLVLWSVLSLSALALGWAGWRALAARSAAPAAAPATAPVVLDDPLPLIPSRQLQSPPAGGAAR